MKTLDDAVIELNGVLPDYYQYKTHEKYVLHPLHPRFGLCSINENGSTKLDFICRAHEFKQRAKELGFVGKYRWGVEYKTDGKRPDLADDVQVQLTLNSFYINNDRVADASWFGSMKFKITDQRYKPADTSYLDKPEVAPVTAERDEVLSAASEFRKFPRRLQELLRDSFEKALLQIESEAKAKAERDALAAQVEQLNSKNFELTCYRVDILRCLKTIAFEHNHDDLPRYQPLARRLMDSISADKELKQVKAEAVFDAVKYCNHYMAFPVTRGSTADAVIAVDDLKKYAAKIAGGE